MKGKTRIVIEGNFNCKWEDCFDGMEICHSGNNTIISGILKDEAHLHGILNMIRDLNLKLTSVNPSEN